MVIFQAIFFLGFFHGLRGDHIIDILNSDQADEIYYRPSLVSGKVGLIHLGYVLALVIPLWLLRIKLSGLGYLSSRPAIGIALWALGLQSLYEFFWVPPKQLHQHEHSHQLDHAHAPKELDRPESGAAEHQPPSYTHRHEHLHFHAPQAKQNHTHQHSARKLSRLGSLHNHFSTLAVSMTALVFPLSGILISLAVFFCGLFLSVYFLGIVYRNKGIDLMGKIDHLSILLLGLSCGLAGLWLVAG